LLSNTCCRIASAASFSTDAVNRLIKRIGERAGFPFKVHVHMLTPAATHWPMRGMTRGQFKTGSDIARSNTPPGTRN
jgi:hypothetical protein